MGSGFSKMKKQAKFMEQQLEVMRNQMKSKSIVGISGNGLVTVTLNGDKELQKIVIKPDCVDPSDLEGLQDLIRAAFEDAYQKIADESSAGVGFPDGMSLPFNL